MRISVFSWSQHSKVGVGILIISLSAWICGTTLLAPLTSFAAAARSYVPITSCASTQQLRFMAVSSMASAGIWLNHTRGPAGTSLAISGSGWPASADITIDTYGNDSQGHSWLDQKNIIQTTTAADGTFQTVAFAAPTSQNCGQVAEYGQPGTFVLFKAHTSDNRDSAVARFSYLAIPSIVLYEGYTGIAIPGSLIRLAGQNWDPGEQVTVITQDTYGQTQQDLENTSAAVPSGVPAAQVKADGSGAFTLNVSVPTDFPLYDYSGFVVSASATSSVYGSFTATPLVFNIPPELAPTFTASLTQALPGSLVIVSGTHWPMGLVLVGYCRGQNPLYGSTNIGCDPLATQGIGFALIQGPGNFSIEVTIPPNARPGPITLQVSADSNVLPAYYTVALPFTVLTPAQPASWQVVHPRLAQALRIGEVALPLTLLVVGGGGAIIFWQRKRRRPVGLEGQVVNR
jgi:hypothetical protein